MADIFEIFRRNADGKRAAAMSAYMRNLFRYLGIPKPKRAELARDFIKQAKKAAAIDWKFVDKCWTLEREFQYLAIDYLNAVAGLLAIADIPRLKKLAETKSWWDTIDCIDNIIGNMAARNPKIGDIMLEWSVDDNFWLRRIAIDYQLCRKEKTNAKLLEKIMVNNFGSKEFFINKAIGWGLREYGKTNPEWVRKFINKYRAEMSPLSIREAGKYIFEKS
jgi:3-methyladenine DNA glycosylase AlkD